MLLFLLIALLMLLPAGAVSQELYSYYLLSQELKVLSATKESLPYSEVPRYTRVITREQIDRWGVRNLFELLDRLPEFYFWKSYFGLKAIGALGLRQSYYSEKIQVLVDGLPITDPSNGSSFSVNDIFSLSNVKQVEIIYGPMTSLYGFNASLAVINLVTYSPSDRSLNMDSSFSTGHDSYVSLFKSFRKNNFSGSISFNYSEERAPHKSYTDIFNVTGNYSTLRKSFVYYLKLKSTSGFYLKSYAVDRDDNFPLTLTGMITTGNTYADRRAVINRVGIEKKLKSYRLDLFADYNWFYLERGYNLCPFNHSICSVVLSLKRELLAVEKRYLRNPRIGILLSKDFKAYGKLFLGAEYSEAELYRTELQANFIPSSIDLNDLSKIISFPQIKRLPDSETLFSPHFRSTFSPYFQYFLVKNSYSILFNGRWNKTNDVGHYWSYSSSLLKKWRNWNIKLNTGRAIRIPSFEEMYIKNNPLLLGNPHLKAEKTDSIMPSIEFNGRTFTVSGMFYVYWFHDFIYKKKISPVTYLWDNADSTVRIRGFVVSLKKRLKNCYEMELSTGRVFSVGGLSSGFTEFPRKKLVVGVSYLGNSLTANISLTAYSRASQDIPGFGRIDLNVVKTVGKQKLFLTVRNLFNKKIYYQGGVPGNERTLWLEWRYSY